LIDEMTIQFLGCLLLSLVSTFGLIDSARALTEPSRLGTHGMVLFGDEDALYAYHLPMFHPPHDVQVLLQLSIADARMSAQVQSQLSQKIMLWTLVPTQFDLSGLQPSAKNPLRTFYADVVQGHFERGGVTKFSHVLFSVKRTLIFRTLDAQALAMSHVDYQWVGHGSRIFLVKRLMSRPDFDHIIALKLDAASKTPTKDLSMPASATIEPNKASILTMLDGAGISGAAILGTVYFDFADLQ
jgi:hypothetical protein